LLFIVFKGQSVVEHILTHGWMLVVIAMIGAALLSVYSDPRLQSSTGFDGDLQLEGFGATSEVTLQMGWMNTAGNEVNINWINVSGQTNYTERDLENFVLDRGESRIVEFQSVEPSDEREVFEVTVNYDRGVLEDLETSGTIAGHFTITDTVIEVFLDHEWWFESADERVRSVEYHDGVIYAMAHANDEDSTLHALSVDDVDGDGEAEEIWRLEEGPEQGEPLGEGRPLKYNEEDNRIYTGIATGEVRIIDPSMAENGVLDHEAVESIEVIDEDVDVRGLEFRNEFVYIGVADSHNNAGDVDIQVVRADSNNIHDTGEWVNTTEIHDVTGLALEDENEGRVYASATDGTIYALNHDLEKEWEITDMHEDTSIWGITSIGIDNHKNWLYSAGDNDDVYALNLDHLDEDNIEDWEEALEWRYGELDKGQKWGLLADEDEEVVYVGDNEGNLHRINETGGADWEFSFEEALQEFDEIDDTERGNVDILARDSELNVYAGDEDDSGDFAYVMRVTQNEIETVN